MEIFMCIATCKIGRPEKLNWHHNIKHHIYAIDNDRGWWTNKDSAHCTSHALTKHHQGTFFHNCDKNVFNFSSL